MLLLCLPLLIVEADNRAVAFASRVVCLRGLPVADRSTLFMLDIPIFMRELLGQTLGALFQLHVDGHIVDEEALRIVVIDDNLAILSVVPLPIPADASILLILQAILGQATFLEA